MSERTAEEIVAEMSPEQRQALEVGTRGYIAIARAYSEGTGLIPDDAEVLATVWKNVFGRELSDAEAVAVGFFGMSAFDSLTIEATLAGHESLGAALDHMEQQLSQLVDVSS